MVKASDNEFPSVLFDEQASDVATPASGFWRIYLKSDGLYLIDDAGAVTGPLGSGGAVSVDEEGTPVVATASAINFVGAAVTVTDGGGGEAVVTIGSGSGSVINTDGDPGTTIYVGSIDPDTVYTPAAGDVWIRVP